MYFFFLGGGPTRVLRIGGVVIETSKGAEKSSEVKRSGNYVFEADKSSTALGARDVRYAVGACVVYIEKVIL